ncbi:hypothetical protein I3679_002190 [Proteus mirabilis]|uniref:Uncharacterized protein n=1 Tax=Proteus mirabilis TaxID=584 RepID=A0ABD5LY55_PROMI
MLFTLIEGGGVVCNGVEPLSIGVATPALLLVVTGDVETVRFDELSLTEVIGAGR